MTLLLLGKIVMWFMLRLYRNFTKHIKRSNKISGRKDRRLIKKRKQYLVKRRNWFEVFYTHTKKKGFWPD